MKKFLLLLVLCSGANPAIAQVQVRTESAGPPPTVSSGDVFIPNSKDNLAIKELREAMLKFARCVSARHPKESNDFILHPTEETWSVMSKKIDDNCLLEAVKNPGEEIQLNSNSQDMMFAISDALVQKKLSAFDPSEIASAGKLPPADPLATIGECAVRANPAGAHALLQARLNSKEELQAVQALMPAFSTCIPKGAEVHFDLTTLRGTIAVNYYRLAFASPMEASEMAK
jgi:hypothetical protein